MHFYSVGAPIYHFNRLYHGESIDRNDIMGAYVRTLTCMHCSVIDLYMIHMFMTNNTVVSRPKIFTNSSLVTISQ